MKQLTEEQVQQVSGGVTNPFAQAPQCPAPPGWGTPWEGKPPLKMV